MWIIKKIKELVNAPVNTPRQTEDAGGSLRPSGSSYQIGDWIGDHHVIDVFGGTGRSGMGVVYLVDGPEGVIVLKAIQEGKNSVSFRNRFKDEATIWVKIGSHPNIVRAIWVDEIDFTLFVAAEYVPKDGEGRNTLSDFIDEGPCSLEQVVAWTYQFCFGMQHAFHNGLKCHRDIKPANIMVAPDGALKITDFGLAKPRLDVDVQADAAYECGAVIQTHGFVGTPLYMAPEQFRLTFDIRSDIYSFGIVLYQLLSGTYPYEMVRVNPRDLSSLYKMHCSGSAQRIESPLFTIVDKCLEKNPDSRYQSFDALLEDLTVVTQQCNIAPLRRPVLTSSDAENDLIARARSLGRLGQSDGALAAIRKYLHLVPDDFSAWTELGRILMEKEDYSGSLDATRTAVTLNSSRSPAWNNLGVIYH